jgi:ribonuclease Z
MVTVQSMFQAKAGLVWRLPGEHATITAAQLQHRVPCWGYVFDELTPQQQQQQQDGETQQQPREQQQQGKQGKQQQARRVLILGDTVDSRAIAPVAYGADLVSHEATFAAGMEGKAAVAQHSTAWMAGQFAWAVEARSLVLTHFSARYEGSSNGGAQQQGGRGGGRGGQQDRRVRAWEVVQAKAEAEAADERAVKALQREAEEFFTQGPILLAADLFTAHVPARQQ